MTTPEGKVKAKIDKLLKSYGPELYYFKPVQSGYGAPSLDYLCCYKGYFFAIEAKADAKKKPTPRQELTIKQIFDAGGTAFVVDNDDTLGVLKSWLQSIP